MRRSARLNPPATAPPALTVRRATFGEPTRRSTRVTKPIVYLSKQNPDKEARERNAKLAEERARAEEEDSDDEAEEETSNNNIGEIAEHVEAVAVNEEDADDEQSMTIDGNIDEVEEEFLQPGELAGIGASLGGGFTNTSELKPMKYKEAMAGKDTVG